MGELQRLDHLDDLDLLLEGGIVSVVFGNMAKGNLLVFIAHANTGENFCNL